MLSVEHVRVRRDGDRLVLRELSAKQRTRAVELAEQVLTVMNAAAGKTRDDVDEELTLLDMRPTERRLVEGLKKLAEDAATFEAVAPQDPAALRSSLFLQAAAARRAASLEQPFSRDAVLAAGSAALGVSVEELDLGLYSDLRGAHRMTRAPGIDAPSLVAEYERSQVQAVLLRAVQLTARVHCRAPEAYRQLFQKLKFRRLLYAVEPLGDGGYNLRIEGPYSMFEAVTKYGLELSLSLPALEACDVLELTADVLWGKNRSKLRFEHRHVTTRPPSENADTLRDDLREILEDPALKRSGWSCQVADELLSVPGLGVCVPDLLFSHPELERGVYFELLGYWSRDAVWKRVEWVERGLAQDIIFGASSKLRVSEEVLETEHAGLYVFRGQPSARGLLKKLESLRARRKDRR